MDLTTRFDNAEKMRDNLIKLHVCANRYKEMEREFCNQITEVLNLGQDMENLFPEIREGRVNQILIEMHRSLIPQSETLVAEICAATQSMLNSLDGIAMEVVYAPPELMESDHFR